MPLYSPFSYIFIFLLYRYKVTQSELFALLCRLADELLFRQIAWVKKLPFFCDLSIKDYTCLLSTTWQELILLSSLMTYSKQIFGDLADVTSKYSPSEAELHRLVIKPYHLKFTLTDFFFPNSLLVLLHYNGRFENTLKRCVGRIK